MKPLIVFVVLCWLLPCRGLASADTVVRYLPYQILIPYSQGGQSNVWEQVHVSAEFISPTDDTVRTGGFYLDQDLWAVRFAPYVAGVWRFSVHVDGGSVVRDTSGVFVCTDEGERGFIRRHPANAHRLVYEADGGIYFPMGIGDCMPTLSATQTSVLQGGFIDGGFRGCNFHEGLGWPLAYDQYATAYGGVAGFNIYRYSDGNCAYSMITNISSSGNTYNAIYSRWTDTLFRELRMRGFRIYMTIMTSPRGSSKDTAQMSATCRYAQYCIDRFGSLVDFWELTNESDPDSLWIADVANYFHAHDPYHHLVSMSNPKPSHPSIDIISPHWYGKEDVRSSDQSVVSQLGSYLRVAKPTVVGEQGDQLWDQFSDIRARARLWSSLFNETGIIFWNTSWTKDCCNQYIGWELRRYARALRTFADQLDSGVAIASFGVAPVNSFRVWGLRSSRIAAAYIHSVNDVSVRNSGVTVTIDVPAAGTATWYDVHTGHAITTTAVNAGSQQFAAPPFVTDIALLIGPPMTIPVDHFTLDVEPRTIEAYGMEVGDRRMQLVRLANLGADTIHIIGFHPDTTLPSVGFGMPPTPTLVAPGDTATLTLLITQPDTVTRSPMLSIETDASPAWENIAIATAWNNGPTYLQPASGAVNVPVNANFQWHICSQNGSDPFTFHLQVARDSAFTGMLMDTILNKTRTDTIAQNIALPSGTKCFWHVMFEPLLWAGAWERTWTFTTAGGSEVVQGIVPTTPQIEVHPNPSEGGTLTVEVHGVSTNAHYALVDLLGRTVAEGVLQSAHAAINVADCATGTYRVVIADGKIRMSCAAVIGR